MAHRPLVWPTGHRPAMRRLDSHCPQDLTFKDQQAPGKAQAPANRSESRKAWGVRGGAHCRLGLRRDPQSAGPENITTRTAAAPSRVRFQAETQLYPHTPHHGPPARLPPNRDSEGTRKGLSPPAPTSRSPGFTRPVSESWTRMVRGLAPGPPKRGPRAPPIRQTGETGARCSR